MSPGEEEEEEEEEEEDDATQRDRCTVMQDQRKCNNSMEPWLRGEKVPTVYKKNNGERERERRGNERRRRRRRRNQEETSDARSSSSREQHPRISPRPHNRSWVTALPRVPGCSDTTLAQSEIASGLNEALPRHVPSDVMRLPLRFSFP
ncbi:hypothetical protein F2P81_001232 [Scophthalmus maximus]|uniref:Uncharacterized protein n=1 Tax=Scophthalmus maximus TaxID=52904 RepID=A0A6A4TRR7_SCOMX|nr:hypothetical protein F2P81_001232 [Scophthalmus maximus]